MLKWYTTTEKELEIAIEIKIKRINKKKNQKWD